MACDLTDDAIAQQLDAVEDNASEKSVIDNSNLKSENSLKMGADTPDSVLKDSGITTVNNWGELRSAINDGAVIELSGNDVYNAKDSGIVIDSGTVTIDGKGRTIDAYGLNSHIFEINDGATLNLKNLTLKNALNNDADVDGGAIYIDLGTLSVSECTFTNNNATSERGGAIYNYGGTLKIVNSRFEKNSKYDLAIYNYCDDKDNPFRLTILNTTMIEDKVCVNYNFEGNDHERKLDDKRDIDFLTTEFNVDIQEILYNGTPVFIDISGIDEDFSGSITVNITNTIHNTEIDVANGKGNTTMNLDINRYTARFKNFIFLDEKAFETDSTKPYLEMNFRIIFEGTLSALEYLIRESTGNVTLNQDYIFNTSCDAPGGIRISGKKLTINGNGHTVKADKMDDGAIFYIENDYYNALGSNVTIANMTLEGAHAASTSHLTIQTRMGGAIYVSKSNLTVINCTFKDNEAKDGFGGAIYGYYSNLNIIDSNFINNAAANGNVLCIWRGNANILRCNVNQEDVHSEFDLDWEVLGSIAIFNDFNATLHVFNSVRDDETLFNITQPENINSVASLTINNNPKGDIQFKDGHASAKLNLDVGSYVATITTPDFVYYTDSARNLTCTYLSATTTSNEFTVIPRTYVVNSSNVGEIFNGTDDALSDFIKPGDILDFQGTIDKNRNLVISKPVNIVSSTKNAVINLHTVIGDSENGIPKFSFIINEGASGSNISDLYINNTQTRIYNVDGLYLKNIIISVRSANNLGAEIGHTAIRFGNHITLDNCSIFTENTNAPCLVLYVTSNFTFINSKIEGQSKIGSIISLEYPNEIYDAPYDNYEATCTNNTIKNSVIKTGYSDADPIKIGENADHTTIDGVKVYASKNINPGQYATVMNSNFYNASGIELDCNGVAYNNTVDGSGSKIQNGANAYNNTFNSVTVGNVVFENNAVTSKLTVSSPSNVNCNNIGLIELKSGSKYSNITNNTISGNITVDDVNVTIKFNTINTENDYAVIVKQKGAVVTNNILYAKTKFGDNAVDRYQDTTVVEDNAPKPSLELLQSLINKATANITLGQDFGYDGDIGDGIIIDKDLKIIGNGYTIDGVEQARIFQITNGANVIIENVTFINGKAQSEEYRGNNHDVGGAITVKSFSNLTIINSAFTNNHADQSGWGGAIFITGNSTLSIMASDFTDSYAQDGGHILYALDGNYVNILECNVDGINICDIDISDMGDYIGNDKGEMGLTAPIKIFKTTNLTVIISNYTEGENAQIKITEPSGFSGRASLNVDNKTVSDIQFNDDGTAYVQLDVTPGKVYAATVTTDYAEYERNIGLNIAKLYVPATASTNSFKVMKKPNIQCDLHNITYNQSLTVIVAVNGTGDITIRCGDIVNTSSISEKVNFTFSKLNAGNYSIELNYSGDEFTVPGTAIFNFTVFKADSSLEINDMVFDYNSTGSTTFACVNASGVRAEVVNNPNASVNVNGNVISVSNLNAGNYTLTVTTIPDDNHNPVTKTSSIRVSKIASVVKIDVKADYNVGESFEISITNNTAASVTVNGNVYTIKKGKVDVNTVDLPAGTYNVIATVAENSNYLGSSDTATFTISKFAAPEIVIDIESSVVEGTDLDVGVSLGDATGTVNINGVNKTLANGKASATISNVKLGNLTIKVTYYGDAKYMGSSNTAGVSVYAKKNPDLIATAENVNVGETATINVEINSEATGKVLIGNDEVSISKGKGNYVISGLAAGNYSYVVVFAGDNYFKAENFTVSFRVTEVETQNNNTNASTGNATEDNHTSGNATGNNTSGGSTTDNNTNVTKVSPKLGVSVEDVNVGESAVVNVSINKDVTGKVVVAFNGKENAVTISNGKGTYEISALAAGTYSLVVRFAGDDYFNADETTVSFRVIEVEAPINNTNASTGNSTGDNPTSGNATGNNISSGDVGGNNSTSGSGSGNNISSGDVGGNNSTSGSGSGNNASSGDVGGNNSTSGNATGNNTSGGSTTDNNTNVTKADPNLSVSVADVNVGETAVVNISINKNVTGKVAVKFNGISTNVFVSNGKGTYSIPNLNVGSYSVVVGFAGNQYFNADEKTVSFKVTEAQSPINNTNASSGNTTNPTIIKTSLSASSVTTVYNGGKYLVATLKDDAGNAISGVKVKIKLNGKSYTKTTDKNGKVKLSVSALAPKKYSVTISFSGNAKYDKSTKKVIVKVTKATPKLTASKKSFKISTGTKKYTVVLKTNKNKAMKKTWVKLKVNKKTYKVKTNSKGRATFKITNLKAKGTFTAVVKYGGNKYYKAKTVKPKIIVK